MPQSFSELIDEVISRGNVTIIEDPDEIYREMSEHVRRPGRGLSLRSVEDSFVVEQSLPTGCSADVKLARPTPDKIKELVEARGMPFREDFTALVEQFWTSDERVDQAGDIVRQNWDFSRYEKLSRVLHAHNWVGLPIGRSIFWEVRTHKDVDFEGRGLFQIFLFTPRDINEEGDLIHRLVKARFLTETSVGFYPLKIIRIDDDDERAELGLGRWGLIFERQLLIETSTCAVACNDGAQVAASLAKAKEEGLLKLSDFECVRSMVASDERVDIINRNAMDESIAETFKELFPRTRKKVEIAIADLDKELTEVKGLLLQFASDLKEGLIGLYGEAPDNGEIKEPDDPTDDDDDLDELDDDLEDEEEDEELEDTSSHSDDDPNASYIDALLADDE